MTDKNNQVASQDYIQLKANQRQPEEVIRR